MTDPYIGRIKIKNSDKVPVGPTSMTQDASKPTLPNAWPGLIVQSPAWEAIMNDPQLERARQKLSFHEIRLIMNHARVGMACPLCSSQSPSALCDKHARQAKNTGVA
jgi:hypothetical protein